MFVQRLSLLFAVLLSFSAKAEVSCRSLYNKGQQQDGVYQVQPKADGPSFAVYCDMARGGWALAIESTQENPGQPAVVEGPVLPGQTGRLSDEKIKSLLSLGNGQSNNIWVEVLGPWQSFHVSISTGGNHRKGIYQVTPLDNAYCQAYEQGPDPHLFQADQKWRFINGNLTGSIGFSESWGFHTDLCTASSAEACGETFSQWLCSDGLPGKVWIQ